MKSNFFLLVLLLLAGLSLDAQSLRFASYQPIPNTFPAGSQYAYLTSDFNVCGDPQPESFGVFYDHCPTLGNVDCGGGCGRNPYRFTVRLYRNGSLIAQQSFQASSHLSNTFFHNVTGSPADYRAHLTFERRRGFFCTGWEVAWSGWSNIITAVDVPATPNFNIDGNPTGGGTINTCISNIRVNAAATTCETKYYLGVQESDPWWNRTNDYEWGRWFTGSAPDNINLQSLSATYSYPPHYTGDPNRQGSILIGGDLPSGHDRHYRVSICTGEPSWECKFALIKVSYGCLQEGEKDINEYVLWEEEEHSLAFTSSENITITYEAAYDEGEELVDLAIDEDMEVEKTNSLSFEIAPNPFHDYTLINIKEYQGEQALTFELYNTLGERVRSLQTRESQFELHRDALPTGIYFYRASSGNQLLSSGKLIIE